MSISLSPKQSFSSFFYFLQQPPKLPLPDVELTLQRYLDAVETFTPTDQLVTTKMNVQNLLEDKQKIQAIMELLQQKFDKEENWVLFSKLKFAIKKLFHMMFFVGVSMVVRRYVFEKYVATPSQFQSRLGVSQAKV